MGPMVGEAQDVDDTLDGNAGELSIEELIGFGDD